MRQSARTASPASAVLLRFQNHMNLDFSEEHWIDLLALIDAKARQDYKSRKISRKKAMLEATQIKGAAQLLLQRLAADPTSAINWRYTVSMYCIFNGGTAQVLGNDISSDMWLHEITKILKLFVGLTDEIGSNVSEAKGKGGRPADKHLRQFADCLADHFVRAGGTFKPATGRPGFPAFLILLWELMPIDRRPDTAKSFADKLSRLVKKQDKVENTSARADYLIQLTKCYWGIPK